MVQTRPYWIDLGIFDEAGKALVAQPHDHEPPAPALIKYLLTETKRRKSWVLITDRTRDESRPIFAIAAPTNTGGAVMRGLTGLR